MGSVRLVRLVLLEGCEVLKIRLLLLVLVMRLKMRRERVAELITCDTVSYTHLTLPTILRV